MKKEILNLLDEKTQTSVGFVSFTLWHKKGFYKQNRQYQDGLYRKHPR